MFSTLTMSMTLVDGATASLLGKDGELLAGVRGALATAYSLDKSMVRLLAVSVYELASAGSAGSGGQAGGQAGGAGGQAGGEEGGAGGRRLEGSNVVSARTLSDKNALAPFVPVSPIPRAERKEFSFQDGEMTVARSLSTSTRRNGLLAPKLVPSLGAAPSSLDAHSRHLLGATGTHNVTFEYRVYADDEGKAAMLSSKGAQQTFGVQLWTQLVTQVGAAPTSAGNSLENFGTAGAPEVQIIPQTTTVAGHAGEDPADVTLPASYATGAPVGWGLFRCHGVVAPEATLSGRHLFHRRSYFATDLEDRFEILLECSLSCIHPRPTEFLPCTNIIFFYLIFSPTPGVDDGPPLGHASRTEFPARRFRHLGAGWLRE